MIASVIINLYACVYVLISSSYHCLCWCAVYACTYVHVCIFLRVCVCTFVYACIRVFSFVHVRVFFRACACVRVRFYELFCVYAFLGVFSFFACACS